MIQDWINLWMWKNAGFGGIGDIGGPLWIFTSQRVSAPNSHLVQGQLYISHM